MGTEAARGLPSLNDSGRRAKSSSSTSSTCTTGDGDGEGLERDHGEDPAEVPPRSTPARALPDHPILPFLGGGGGRNDGNCSELPERKPQQPVHRHAGHRGGTRGSG